jgi:hypothetical protein
VTAEPRSGAAPWPLWKDLAAGLSFANIAFLRIWSELLTYTGQDAYTMKVPPGPADYLAASLNVLLLGGLLGVGLRFARRIRNPIARGVARGLFFLLLLLPLNAVRAVLSQPFPYLRSPLFGLLGTRGVLLLALGLGVAAIVILLRWPRQVESAVLAVLLVLSPLVPMTLAQAAWNVFRADRAALAAAPLAPALAGAPATRVVWVIFDEWDQRLTFVDRPRSIRLPELDRFRAGALYATDAYSPGPETIYSMPALTAGKLVADTRKVGPSELLLFLDGQPSPVSWGRQPNVFSRARELGFNTAVVGWFHPYCRVLAWSLTDCWWWPMYRQHSSMGSRLSEILPNQARSLFETSLLSVFGQSLPTVRQAETYQAMLVRSRQVVASSRYGLTLLHLPMPHAPHAYNSRTRTFDRGNSPIRGYPDSLILTDLAVGDLRRTMERAGTWDGAVILLSSDHSWRAAANFDGKKDHRVPFLQVPWPEGSAYLSVGLQYAAHARPAAGHPPCRRPHRDRGGRLDRAPSHHRRQPL